MNFSQVKRCGTWESWTLAYCLLFSEQALLMARWKSNKDTVFLTLHIEIKKGKMLCCEVGFQDYICLYFLQISYIYIYIDSWFGVSAWGVLESESVYSVGDDGGRGWGVERGIFGILILLLTIVSSLNSQWGVAK